MCRVGMLAGKRPSECDSRLALTGTRRVVPEGLYYVRGEQRYSVVQDVFMRV